MITQNDKNILNNIKEKEIKYLFENIKIGDTLGFYHSNFYHIFSKLIYLFTKTKIDHVAKVYDIYKTGQAVYFTLAEYKMVGFRLRECRVIKNGDNYLLFLGGYKYEALYYCPIKESLNEKQITALRKFVANKKTLELSNETKYNFKLLPLTVNWVAKYYRRLFGGKIFGKITNIDNNEICTTFVLKCDNQIGLLTDYELLYKLLATTKEVVNQPYYNIYKINLK